MTAAGDLKPLADTVLVLRRAEPDKTFPQKRLVGRKSKSNCVFGKISHLNFHPKASNARHHPRPCTTIIKDFVKGIGCMPLLDGIGDFALSRLNPL